MTWTFERRVAAAVAGPLVLADGRDDTVVVERPGWHQVITPSAAGFLNEVKLSEVAEADAERVIDEAVATYFALGQPVKWCVGPWTKPDDFGDRLSRRGFRSWDVRGMGISTDAAIAAPHGVEIVEVDLPELETFNEVSLRGWSVDASQLALENARLAKALAQRPRLVHLFLARCDGETLGSAGYVVRGDNVYLYATQVLERARGRGLYKALVAARLHHARARGAEYAVTQAREATSAPILEHIGFETLFRSKCYVLDPPA